MADTPPPARACFHIANEFAAVEIEPIRHGRGTRLRVTAGRTGTTGSIDATVLEALTVLTESELMAIVAMAVDPGPASDGLPGATTRQRR